MSILNHITYSGATSRQNPKLITKMKHNDKQSKCENTTFTTVSILDSCDLAQVNAALIFAVCCLETDMEYLVGVYTPMVSQ